MMDYSSIDTKTNWTKKVRLTTDLYGMKSGSIVEYNVLTRSVRNVGSAWNGIKVDKHQYTPQLSNINRETVETAIKAQKWNKHSYVYGCDGMNGFNYYDTYKKAELIEIFYKLAETEFCKIAHYTTFAGLDCYLPIV